ncbi:TPA: Ni/Fe hydrogenase subunit alpha [Candidatus Poribacteria bacterium]|nr:Ni/Fe hydrogenase subunit alpha [Candidatus Poribacteria bacterium]
MGQTITISPITRIEGHAKVFIQLNGDGKVDKTYFQVNQFRGFEKFCEGRMFFEMPVISPRICGICPVTHHLVSAKACDEIIGVKIPRTAEMLRELMHMGQIVQSHALHFFYLASPDLLLGFDADPAIRNVAGLIEKHPELAIKGVKLRKFGQEILATLSNKRVHGNFAVPGGVNKALSIQERDKILSQYDEMISYGKAGLDIIKDWLEKNKDLAQKFGSFKSGYMGLVDESDSLNLYDGIVKLIDKDGNLWERFNGKDYLNYIGEQVLDWSYLKSTYYKKEGYPNGVYRVGPLGRLNSANQIKTPIANEELKEFKGLAKGPVEGSLYYHYARMIELIYGLENIKELLEDKEITSKDILAEPKGIKGHGVGVIEAPRGTVFHDYHCDETGKLTSVNLIIATGHNNWAMSKAVDTVAKEFVDSNRLKEGMLNRVEASIRCYDPCLSCSTHAIGKMPMIIELIDNDGNVIDRLQRD